MLTPKSKVRALLAQFGDDSDENESNSISVMSKPTRTSTNNAINILVTNSCNNTSDADDEDAPVQMPRGKMAARLLAQGARETHGADSEDVYTRIRRQLLSEKEKQHGGELVRKVHGSGESTIVEEHFPVKANNSPKLAKRRSQKPTPQTSPSSTPHSRGSSPGLFVSPRAASATQLNPSKLATIVDSDSDTQLNTTHNVRFQELVARKRAERKAREEESRKKEEEKLKRLGALSARSRRSGRVGSDSDEDGEVGRRLTQQSRPTRKASKKALEELSRETQRMNRNMQLAHQAKTKKKITTKDLFARFNFRQDADAAITTKGSQGNTSNSMLVSSDVEGQHEHDTPPTSPPSQDEHSIKGEEGAVLPVDSEDTNINEELSTFEDVIDQSVKRIDKGKGRAMESQHIPINPQVTQTAKSAIARNIRIVLSNPLLSNEIDLDSDEDLHIVRKRSRFPVFHHLHQELNKDSHSLLTLRALAHLTSPNKRGQKSCTSMSAAELQASLQRRARQQAQVEREEKLNELRARGVIIQTEEEREKDQLELENLLEKARKEAMEIAKKEKEDAKRDGKGDADRDFMDSEDEEDGDWEGSGNDEAEDEGGIELSGSEEEVQTEGLEEEIDEEIWGKDEGANKKAESIRLSAREAEEDCDEDSTQGNPKANDEASDEETIRVPARQRALNRSRHIIADEEDDNDDNSQKELSLSRSTEDDSMVIFGFDHTNATSLGLTQMFAGTMANFQSQSQHVVGLNDDPEQDSLAFLRNVPMATLPNLDAIIADASQDFVIPNSQASTFQQKDELTTVGETSINLDLSQFKSQSQTTFFHTQLSDIPEPTQDVGFELSRSPAGFVGPPCTTNAIITVAESPIAKKKGRLFRRKETVPAFSDIDQDEAVSDPDREDEFEISANAFNVMLKAAKKPSHVDNFDKKKSEAKGMVEEQAEESEDEYAGLGGQSDDESNGELDEEVAKMIDEGEVYVDERKIAAYYADKERADDEKRIDKLYKDITNGGLRRKRGNDFELSDSDDDVEKRRRRKQREFTKMRKALLEDENIGKIAQNPKKSAFLRTIEDRDDDPDLDPFGASEFDFEVQGSKPLKFISIPDSQQLKTTTPPIAQPHSLKRKHILSNYQEKENRPPPNLRRTTANETVRKPVSLSEIRDSVSFLIDEPHTIPESQFSASESEDEDHETDGAKHAPVHRTIVDRLSLSRKASTTNPSTESSGALAFHAPSAGSHQPGFRVPGLIRRVASNLSAKTSTNSTTSSGTTTPIEATGVRRGGSGKSNIHYQAREAERRAALEKAEERRREKVRKRIVKGSSRSVLGVLGVGDEGFE
ncbi:hypothetical protein AOQ84DRAFT_223366 [Glonium stellatum]|uniref:DNA replication checkpoint mediator MRC1 domain-containing protein n=1 Tax=Glonium stellatum TaxID=574774 RepID=A0A8E2EYD3_9PEZI|nr:hypothetical protein AOQ84DRAFT_223366 [Glonium stellatum]